MAEFQKVLRQWRRMCQCHNCKECPGRTIGNKDIICILTKTENRRTEAEVEEIIATWAAEHPEPVYPTWEEWLQSVDVMESAEHIKNRCQCELLIDGIVAHAIPTRKVLEPIPADIAEKLGIEPKEG